MLSRLQQFDGSIIKVFFFFNFFLFNAQMNKKKLINNLENLERSFFIKALIKNLHKNWYFLKIQLKWNPTKLDLEKNIV